MSAFAGVDLSGNGAGVQLPATSSDLSLATYQSGQNLSASTAVDAAGARAAGTTAAAHRAVAGAKQELFGGQLFGKIIVSPRAKALGFVLTATQFAIEVWNAFRESDQTLDAINITGSGGLSIGDTWGEPLVFAALDSRVYQATVPSSGAAQISQDIVFAFASGVGGADCAVTGSRITLFSVAPDWKAGVGESIEYLTDVLKAYSDNEQRRALRQLPRRALRITPLALTARNSAGMESLVWGWQNQPYGLPWWQDATPLTADVAEGATVIPCNTADRQFAAGGLLCIWQDEFTFEALSVESVAADSVTVSSPTQFSWTANAATLVMPVFLARLPKSAQVARHTSFIDEMELQFIGEAQQPAPAPSATLTQYKGYDVLEIAPNWAAGLDRQYNRSLVTIDPKIGPIEVIDKGGSAIVSQRFPWWLDGHSNVTAFRAFILARFGRMNPFWVPTWDQDLVLAQDVGATDTAIKIESEFYSRFFFPSTARRDLAFISSAGAANIYRRVTAAVDNGDGTETLTLDSAPGAAVPAASTMVSFLTLARLAADKAEITWSTADHAEAELEFQEVPREIP
ncbi:MAG: hypothetical protein ACRD4R_06700 [Candidatus Acidiferrales bacterium]